MSFKTKKKRDFWRLSSPKTGHLFKQAAFLLLAVVKVEVGCLKHLKTVGFLSFLLHVTTLLCFPYAALCNCKFKVIYYIYYYYYIDIHVYSENPGRQMSTLAEVEQTIKNAAKTGLRVQTKCTDGPRDRVMKLTQQAGDRVNFQFR